MKLIVAFLILSLPIFAFAGTPVASVAGFQTSYTYQRFQSNAPNQSPIPCNLAAYAGNDKSIGDKESPTSCHSKKMTLDTAAKECLADQAREVDHAMLSKDREIVELRQALLQCQFEQIDADSGLTINIELKDFRQIKPVTENGVDYTLKNISFDPSVLASFGLTPSISVDKGCQIYSAKEIVAHLKAQYKALKPKIVAPAAGCATRVLSNTKPVDASGDAAAH